MGGEHSSSTFTLNLDASLSFGIKGIPPMSIVISCETNLGLRTNL